MPLRLTDEEMRKAWPESYCVECGKRIEYALACMGSTTCHDHRPVGRPR